MHIFLVGYRGCGKSTVGRLLADRLDWQFVDSDDLIEKAAGQTIADIFAQEGEEGFRLRETEVITDFSSLGANTVVSLGGGAVLKPGNRVTIRDLGKCVWLDATPEVLFARISADETSLSRRPNLTGRGGYEEVAEVLRTREPIYSSVADLRVDTGERTPEQIVEELTSWVISKS